MSRHSFTRSSNTIRLLILGGTLTLCFLFSEVFLRAYFSLRLNYDMEMWRYATTLKRETPDARSHLHIPLSHARLMGVDVAINSKGLRDHEYEYKKPKNTYRILAIGDSETFGWGVPVEATFAKTLESKLKRTEVINFGIGNYNTEQELAAFLLEGTKYRPDAILLFIFLNDAEPVQKNAFNFVTRNSYLYAFASERVIQLKSLFSEKNRYINYYNALYEGSSWSHYTQTLNSFVEQTRRRGVKLIPVLLPEMRCLENYPFKRTFHWKISQAFARMGIQTIDLLPVFEGKVAAEYMVARDDSHPNAKAHLLIADEVLRQIRERKLIP